MLFTSHFVKKINPRTKIIISFSIISIVSFICYSNSLQNDFVYDDNAVIVKNEMVNNVSNLSSIFTSSYWEGYRWEGVEKKEQSLYRPLVIFSYALNYLINGLNPFGYHLVNLLLHLINSILVFLVCLYLFEHWKWVSSLIVSLLFVVHPLHTEAVTSIVGRAELLCFCFFMLALWFYVRARVRVSSHKGLFYLLSLLNYFFALISKESAITLLGVVILVDWLYGCQGQMRAMLENGLSLFKRNYLGFLLVTLICLMLRFLILKNPMSTGAITMLDNPLTAVSFWQRILTALTVICKYLALLVFPVRLSADYSFNQIPVSPSLFAIESLCSLFLVGTLLGVAFWWSRKEKILSLAILFFFITLSVTSNLLIVIGTIMAERLLYLPSLGFCIFVVALGQKCLGDVSRDKGNFFVSSLMLMVLLIVSLYGMRTLLRNRDWRNESQLFSSVIRNAPQSARGHNQMAAVYFQKGDYTMALHEAKRSLAIYPDYKEARYCLGTIYNKTGHYDKAIIELTHALRIYPLYPSALLNLGTSYHHLKQYDNAIGIYKDLVAIRPDYAEAYNNLGISYYFKGMVDEAVSEYLYALKLNPDYADACKNLGVLYYQKKGDSKRSRYYLEKSLAIDPRQPQAKQIREFLRSITKGKSP